MAIYRQSSDNLVRYGLESRVESHVISSVSLGPRRLENPAAPLLWLTAFRNIGVSRFGI